MWQRQIICLLSTAMLLTVVATEVFPQSLENRSRIELSIGMGGRTGSGVTVSESGVTSETKAGGFLGSIGFSRWIQKDLAVLIEAGALAVDVSTSTGWAGETNHTAAISYVSFGARYYFLKSLRTASGQPYVSVSAGPVIGTESSTRIGSEVVTESVTRTAIGGRLGAGMDIQLSRLFMLAAGAGHNLMTDFSIPIGARKNHSGPDFRISISVLLGKGTG